jgi:DNA-binding GntR family transcriptional regulator
VPSLGDKAYYKIKRNILTLAMPPGSLVDEETLKEALQMGRTPIREALQRLAREDMVKILPRRGMFVTDISVTDLRQIFEARVPLEIACARLAADRANEDAIAALEALVRQIPAACEATDRRSLMRIDEQIHELLFEASDSKFLADGLIWLYALSLRIWYLTVDQMGGMEDAMREHLALVEALKRRDADGAEVATRQHLAAFQDRVRAAL